MDSAWIRREGERARPPASHVHTLGTGAPAEAAEEVRSTPQTQEGANGHGRRHPVSHVHTPGAGERAQATEGVMSTPGKGPNGNGQRSQCAKSTAKA